jgi:hypothetical protein
MKKYKIVMEKLIRSNNPEVFISKEQIKEIYKLANEKNVTGVIVYLESY